MANEFLVNIVHRSRHRRGNCITAACDQWPRWWNCVNAATFWWWAAIGRWSSPQRCLHSTAWFQFPSPIYRLSISQQVYLNLYKKLAQNRTLLYSMQVFLYHELSNTANQSNNTIFVTCISTSFLHKFLEHDMCHPFYLVSYLVWPRGRASRPMGLTA